MAFIGASSKGYLGGPMLEAPAHLEFSHRGITPNAEIEYHGTHESDPTFYRILGVSFSADVSTYGDYISRNYLPQGR